MSSRREFILGGAMLAAAGSAAALTPRRRLSLLEGDLDTMIPRSFGDWRELPADALVVPQSEGSLAARLYDKTVGRIYEGPQQDVVMLLIAYGSTQSDQLQLHRPEICYPAFGFEVVGARATAIPVGAEVAIPGRRLEARSNLRSEQIAYWTRIGEYLPASDAQQRVMKLKTAFEGWVADGVLVRVSNVNPNADAGFELNRRFTADFAQNLAGPAQRVLMGTALAKRLQA